MGLLPRLRLLIRITNVLLHTGSAVMLVQQLYYLFTNNIPELYFWMTCFVYLSLACNVHQLVILCKTSEKYSVQVRKSFSISCLVQIFVSNLLYVTFDDGYRILRLCSSLGSIQAMVQIAVIIGMRLLNLYQQTQTGEQTRLNNCAQSSNGIIEELK